MSGWANSDRRQRLPKNWPQLRRQVLRRDKGVCQIRGPLCTVRATEVDHIKPNDDDWLSNLQAACSPCHLRKTIAERPTRQPKTRPTERHPGLREAT